ncbi:hypothetical protein ACFPC0_10995 [Streptomyces andamanensis]|uniref:Uncharacterized protein n=1 Tax=Streptomyces andamanensis TaxID=1565035 RepID=A0ABV8TCU4_9ACTN
MTTPVLTPQDADPVLGPRLQSFLACVCAELAAAGRPVCNCCLVWGSTKPPADFCDCECEGGASGQAWVRLVRLDPQNTQNRTQMMKCQPVRVRAWVEAGVYRCVPVGDDQGNPPTCEERTASALGFIADARALRQAVACCQALRRDRVEFISQDPADVSGGCSGVSVQFTLDL